MSSVLRLRPSVQWCSAQKAAACECVCVSVGWCQYLTGRREILKRGVSGGPYLHPDFQTSEHYCPQMVTPNSFLPKNLKGLFACVCYRAGGDVRMLSDGVTLRESADFSKPCTFWFCSAIRRSYHHLKITGRVCLTLAQPAFFLRQLFVCVRSCPYTAEPLSGLI